jgi:hypothetical protein
MGEKSADCYIEVWRDTDFGGEMIRIQGPAEYPNLRFAQGDWGDDIGSLRVGPNAFVLAYRDRDFKDGPVTFGPNDEVADMRGLKFDDEADSLKLIDSLKIFDRLSYNAASGADAACPDPQGARGGPKPHRKKANRHKGRRR